MATQSPITEGNIRNKKNKYLTYSKAALTEALNAVAKGMSIRSASQKFKVPFSTIRCKHKGIYDVDKRSGPATILTREEEQQLVDYILLMGNKGFPFTKHMLLDSVALLMKKLKKKTPFTGGRPGRHWLEGFLKRYPQLKMRTPQSLNKKRGDVTEKQLRGWFEEVGSYLKSKNLLDIDSSRIFNCDESAFFLCPKGNNVLANKKSKAMYNLVAGNDKECLTALITGNAAGQMAPPMVMYSYKRLPAMIVEKAPENWSVGLSNNGWMTGEAFYEYVANVFYPWCRKMEIEFPIIMYMDGHLSRTTLALSDFCIAKEIELVSLYPNATHIMQPMDVAIFPSLKSEWKNAVTNWRIENGGSALQKSDFAPVLKIAIDSMNPEQSLRNGFHCCGLSPFSLNAINYRKVLNNHEAVQLPKTANEDHKSTLEFIESSIDKNTLQLFKIAKNRNGKWYGAEKFAELFVVWLKCENMAKSNCTMSDHQGSSAGIGLAIENESREVSSIVETISDINADVVESVIIDVNVSKSSEANFSLDFRHIAVSDNTIPLNKTLNQVVLPTTASNIENVSPNENEKRRDIIIKTPEFHSTIQSEVFETPNFWPCKTPSSTTKVNRKAKRKVPAVATSKAWQQLQIQKLAEKEKQEQEKEERKVMRITKKKIKQEKDEEKAQLLKRRKINKHQY